MRGKNFGFFKSNRGLRQGDPLSPSLFIIAMEILSRNLNKAAQSGGGIMPYWSSIRALEINHILYADDILAFTNGGRRSFAGFMRVLNSFCSNSGQELQPSKCKLFFSKHITNVRRNALLRRSGYSLGSFPIQYLGAPLFPGQPRLSYFQRLLDVIRGRVEGWMTSFLSMAGRLTLIKSVLASIPIHTMAALPVPRGILASIEKLLRGFIWGMGDGRRRHWVNWNIICSGLEVGGLGIRPLNNVMNALRGKMAWNYLCNDSLWSKHARSRFVIGGKGSYLWKAISPYISGIALDCYWELGDGKTSAGVFCQNIAVPCPKRLRFFPIKEVMQSVSLRRDLVRNVNPRILKSVKNSFEDNKPDRLVWDRVPGGAVTSKAFHDIFHPVGGTIRKFEVIWQSWIPLKVSCFLWKILHSAIASHDNVQRVGVSIASRCVCCLSPDTESMEHIFINSDKAAIIWDIVCPIFRKRRPGKISHIFFDWGVSANFNSYSDCLAFGLVSMCLWELWKSRNCVINGDRATNFNRGCVLRWADSIARCLPKNCSFDLNARRVCCDLRILAPAIPEFKVSWMPWCAFEYGNSCNLGIHVVKGSSVCSAIIRDHMGCFMYAIRICSTEKHFLKCLLQILSEIRGLHIGFGRIQASHADIQLLGRNMDVEWHLFQIKRSIVRSLAGIDIYRVCPSLNIPADALCFSRIGNMRSSKPSDLPLSVRKAISVDSNLHPCSFRDQRVFT